MSYEINASGNVDKKGIKKYALHYFNFEDGQYDIFTKLLRQKKNFIIKTTSSGKFTVIESNAQIPSTQTTPSQQNTGATQQPVSSKLPNGITKFIDGDVITYEINPRKGYANELKNFAKTIQLNKNNLDIFDRSVNFGLKFEITGTTEGKFKVTNSNS